MVTADWSKGPVWRPSKTASAKAKRQAKATRDTTEAKHKRLAKARDGWRCRFPLCGCKDLGLALEARLESSHGTHKGMGGDKTGARSKPPNLVTLCRHRHQDGAISRHKGTLKARFLTSRGFDGPIAWEVDAGRLASSQTRITRWIEVARETAIQVWIVRHAAVVRTLGEMDL